MSLLENMAKQVVIIKDSILDDILSFLDSCQCTFSFSILSSTENDVLIKSFGIHSQPFLQSTAEKCRPY